MKDLLFLRAYEPLEGELNAAPDDPPGFSISDGDGGVYFEGSLDELARLFLRSALSCLKHRCRIAVGSGALDDDKAAPDDALGYVLCPAGKEGMAVAFAGQQKLFLIPADNARCLLMLQDASKQTHIHPHELPLRAALVELALTTLPKADELPTAHADDPRFIQL